MNKFLERFKIPLIRVKYNYLYLKRNFLFKPKSFLIINKFKKKRKIVICGNGPSYNDFESEYLQGKYEDYDILMLNSGAIHTNLSINFHIFELFNSNEENADYLKKISQLDTKTCRIFRPRNVDNVRLVEEFNVKNIFIIKEKRVRQNNISIFYKDLDQFYSDNILFCRSSIVYATLFALRLEYDEVLYVGVNPDTISSFYSNPDIIHNEVHPTFNKVGEFNSYDIIRMITNFKLFQNTVFKVHQKSYNFLNKKHS
ncbi:hypothetical protein [Xanthomarina gelatinilytica]|uniref:hypothetical protein n=1 Tax=Xanthomarina gelatinilytica TaxID=1137281 RepID=UPI003AA80833